jgi:tripartite-type tricarboxylate transporter receptor subunit TctC
MTTRLLATLLPLLLALPWGAFAQEPFPSRPITMVAPFPPGGVADLTARPVAAAMEKVLKSPVVVVNKTGAAGAVGMSFVANSKPDGYTILMALSSISIIPEADKLFDRSRPTPLTSLPRSRSSPPIPPSSWSARISHGRA